MAADARKARLRRPDPKQMHFRCIGKPASLLKGLRLADESPPDGERPVKKKTQPTKEGLRFRRVCIDLSTRRAPG